MPKYLRNFKKVGHAAATIVCIGRLDHIFWTKFCNITNVKHLTNILTFHLLRQYLNYYHLVSKGTVLT